MGADSRSQGEHGGALARHSRCGCALGMAGGKAFCGTLEPMEPMEPVMRDVLEEHLDEAAFHFSRWEQALLSPHLGISHTAEREERLLAHLDGLVVGGESATTELLLPALEAEEAERVSAASLALLDGPGARGLEATLAAFDGGSAMQREYVGRALGLSERDGLAMVLTQRLSADDVHLRIVAFEVLAFRDMVPAETRLKWLHQEDAGQVVAALRDTRPLPHDALRGALPRLLSDPRPGVREAAILAGLVSGSRAAWKACHEAAELGGVGRRQCLLALALGGEAREVEWLTSLLPEEELRPDVLWALGFSGQARAAEACLEWMSDEKAAALAGEAFSAITGLELNEQYQQAPREEEEMLIPLEEEDLNADLAPGPEASLPVPRREAVEGWWHEARKGFERGARYLRGKRLGAAELLAALGSEPMRRRPALALELAIRSRGTRRLQPRAFTSRQRAEWEAVRTSQAGLSMRSFTQLCGD